MAKAANVLIASLQLTYLIIKALLSRIIVAIISELATRYPGFGGLIASLPLISILGIVWLWRDTSDIERLASHAEAKFWSAGIEYRRTQIKRKLR